MANSINMITILEDGDFNGVFSGFAGTPSTAFGVDVLNISDIADTTDTDAQSTEAIEFILNKMKNRRNTIKKDIRAGTGITICSYVLCITKDMQRLPVHVSLFEKISAQFQQLSYMDIVVVADSEKKIGCAVDKVLASINGVFGLKVFYTDSEALLSEDIRSVCANLAENRLKGAAGADGLYVLRASVGSMGDFQLFFELSARRLEEAEKKGRLELNANDIRSFAKRFTEKGFRKLNADAFRYIIWNKNFTGRFEAAGEYRERDPFAENVKKFIALNCAEPFYKDMEEMLRITGQFSRMFFEEFVEGFDKFIGKVRIEIMGEALAVLRKIKDEIEQEKTGVLHDNGNKPSDADQDNLWAYSDYMYKNYFTRIMELERFSCELNFIDKLIVEIDKAAINEKNNLDLFNKIINEKRNNYYYNNFAKTIYDKISDLFKCNSEAEIFLLKCITEYLNSLKEPSHDLDSSIGMVLFAPTAEKFRILMENNINVIFIQDLPEGIKNRFDILAQSLLPEPVLLIGSYTYDSVKQGLGLGEPVFTIFKPFGGYASDIAKILDNDENTVALYEYYKINTGDSSVISMLAKIV